MSVARYTSPYPAGAEWRFDAVGPELHANQRLARQEVGHRFERRSVDQLGLIDFRQHRFDVLPDVRLVCTALTDELGTFGRITRHGLVEHGRDTPPLGVQHDSRTSLEPAMTLQAEKERANDNGDR